MAEQQLIDYIKKAREAGQSDDQTRNLLYKNGWTTTEVGDAFAALNQPSSKLYPEQARPQTQPQPQAQPQPQVQQQPQQQPRIQIQTQPQSPSGMPQNNMPQMKTRSHSGLKLLTVLIIIIVLCGAGYFVASQYFNLPWNSFGGPNPQTVISKMMNNMKNAKFYRTITQAEIDLSDSASKTPEGKLELSANSEVDATDVNNLKYDGNFTASLTAPGADTPSASFNASVAAIGGAFYLELNNIVIPPSSLPGFDASKINGRWFKIDKDSIKALSQAEAGQAGVPDFSQINGSGLYKNILNLLPSENMISVNKQLNDETVNGKSAYHYLLTINKDRLKDFINKLIALQTQNVPADNSGLSVQGMAQSFADSLADAAGNTNMEIWVGKDDFMLYEAKLDKVIDLSTVLPGVNTLSEIKFNMTNSNFNKVITVQAPATTQKIEDVISPLLKAYNIQSDMKEIGVIAQSALSVNKTYSVICKNGLLNGVLKAGGKEFTALGNDLENQGVKNLVCFGSLQSYCVSTQQTDGSYLCMSASNILGKTRCLSARTVCK